MYLDFMSEIVLLTCIFVVVKSGVNVLISPGRSIRSPPAVIIVLQFVFGSDVTNWYHIGFLSIIWLVFVKNELYCVGYCMFFPTLGQAAKFVAHWVVPYFRIYFHWVSVSPKVFCCFTVDVIFHWFQCYYYFFGVYSSMLIWAYV